LIGPIGSFAGAETAPYTLGSIVGRCDAGHTLRRIGDGDNGRAACKRCGDVYGKQESLF
jgi:hypothetical protein